MKIHFKFESATTFDTLLFVGESSVRVLDLKRAIVIKQNLTTISGLDFDLLLTNAQTGKLYEGDDALVPHDTRVIAQCIPCCEPGHGMLAHMGSYDSSTDNKGEGEQDSYCSEVAIDTPPPLQDCVCIHCGVSGHDVQFCTEYGDKEITTVDLSDRLEEMDSFDYDYECFDIDLEMELYDDDGDDDDDQDDDGDNHGFLALETSTSTGVWNQPALRDNRIESAGLHRQKLISSGTRGDVWLGEFENRQVAIKSLPESNQNMANALVFAAEIELMAALRHPSITAFIGVEWTSRPWHVQAVSEYMVRGDLRTLLDSQDDVAIHSWTDFLCQAATDVAAALTYLHARSSPVILGAFSARNVLVTDTASGDQDDTVVAKLSLFAVARSLSSSSPSPMEVCSSSLAPEIIRQERKTDKSSIYAFGVLLCELDGAAGARLPFHDALNPDGSRMSRFKIAQLVARHELQPSVSDDCPDGIAALTRQCLAFDPLERPSAASVVYSLKEILKNEL